MTVQDVDYDERNEGLLTERFHQPQPSRYKLTLFSTHLPNLFQCVTLNTL
jgi:hypothetical protein